MENITVLTVPQLAERWQCTRQQIYSMIDQHRIKPIENLPKHRFSIEYIKELETVGVDPLSPFERKKLERTIDGLEKRLEEKERLLMEIRGIVKWKWNF